MIAGVDGCPGGWVAVICEDDLRLPEARFIEHLAELPRNLTTAAVDIPIGLPSRGRRDADLFARSALRHPRCHSVFFCPARPVVAAPTWEEACAISAQIDGWRISKQTFGILRKVAEADCLLRTDPWARRIIREVHPELSFARWMKAPMRYRKKSRAGREERQRLITATFGEGAFESALESLRSRGVRADDLADAFAAVWTAARIVQGKAERLPQTLQTDAEGLPMQILA